MFHKRNIFIQKVAKENNCEIIIKSNRKKKKELELSTIIKEMKKIPSKEMSKNQFNFEEQKVKDDVKFNEEKRKAFIKRIENLCNEALIKVQATNTLAEGQDDNENWFETLTKTFELTKNCFTEVGHIFFLFNSMQYFSSIFYDYCN